MTRTVSDLPPSHALRTTWSALAPLRKPVLLLVSAILIIVAAIWLFELSAERARAAAAPLAAVPAIAAAPATPAMPIAPVAPATPATPAKPAVPPATATSHQVTAGETLTAVALRYNVPTEQLTADNALTSPDHVRAGQHLIITANAGTDYVIKPGDTLSALAQEHHLSLSTLRGLNPQVANPDRILAGSRLDLTPRMP